MKFETSILSSDNQTRLFWDYLRHDPVTQSYFKWKWDGDWEQCLNARLQADFQQTHLKNILLEQNRGWGAPPPVEANIEKLAENNCLLVMTGQQAGLFGGPLYTIYKIIAAIKLADYLQAKFPKQQILPAFWMEVNDNDYPEINHVYQISIGGELNRYQLPEAPGDLRAVARRKWPAEIRPLLEQFENEAPASEFREKIFQTLREIYRPGTSLVDSFAAFLLHLFGDRGLILINPADTNIKKLMKPVFKEALSRWDEIQDGLQNVNQALQTAGYHRQIKLRPDQTLLFFETEDQSRCRVDAVKQGFIVRHPEKEIKFSAGKMAEELENHSGRFSPNVALRPLVQDFLFPTIAYIAGPGEIAYAAQLISLYRLFKITPPVIFPRPRLTVVERNVEQLVEKFEFSYVQIQEKGETLVQEFLRSHTAEQLGDVFGQVENSIENEIQKLHGVIKEIDPTLLGALQKTSGQIEKSFNQLRNRAEKAFARRLDSDVRQINKIIRNLAPAGQPQERVFNIINYLIKYGPEFIDGLFTAIKVGDIEHQLLFPR